VSFDIIIKSSAKSKCKTSMICETFIPDNMPTTWPFLALAYGFPSQGCKERVTMDNLDEVLFYSE
jgi:hypothetical protein